MRLLFTDPGLNLDLIVPENVSRMKIRCYGAGGQSTNLKAEPGRYTETEVSCSPGDEYLVHVGGTFGSIAVGGKSLRGSGGGASVVAKLNKNKEYDIICVAGGGGGAGINKGLIKGVPGNKMKLTGFKSLVSSDGNGGWPDSPEFHDGRDPNIPPDDSPTNSPGGNLPWIQTNVIEEITVTSGGGGGGYPGGFSGSLGSYGQSGGCYPLLYEYDKKQVVDDLLSTVSLPDNPGAVVVDFIYETNEEVNKEDNSPLKNQNIKENASSPPKPSYWIWWLVGGIVLISSGIFLTWFILKKNKTNDQYHKNQFS